MADQKLINRLKLMLEQAERVLEQADPDWRVLEKLLAGALDLASEASLPPDPYANKTLRPGLDVIHQQGESDG